MRNAARFVSLSLLLVASFARPSLADEGMWVYNNLPTAQLKKKYNFEPTAAWAEHLMKASVRFNSGGSGSFVSPAGLVLTNHHVGADTLAKISSPGHDYYKNGFWAKTPAEEVRAPDLELNVLQSIEDVTARVNAAVKEGMSSEQAALARRAIIAQIEKESLAATGLRSDVVTLYQGGQYHLYRYKKYTDVRLVFAPEFAIAFFGGDPDNFEYPRYDLDMCLFRVYENGKPVKVDHYLKWSEAGVADGDLVFVSGHPGRTSRLYTTAALTFLRDLRVPYTLSLLRRRENVLLGYSQQGDEQARRAKGQLFGVQNSRKVYVGLLQGLQDRDFLARKQRAEYELRARVEAETSLKELGGAWDAIAAAEAAGRRLYVRRQVLESGQAFNSQLFGIARSLVRMAEEDAKPNSERLPEYRESNRASLEQALYSTAPIYADLEKVTLADSLGWMAEALGADSDVVRLVLQGKSPEARAAELVDGTSLANPNVRRLIAKGGKSAIESSYDSMILLAKAVDAASRAIRKSYEDKVEEPERQGYAQIARALFAIYGTNTYPDATFTLRLSFGEVKGYDEAGRHIPSLTTMGGAFAHEAAHGARDPWKLPESWQKAKASGALKLETPFNFVSTADIIGGNSGSPVVNKAGELVGLIFDGNIHSLTADYAYDDVQSRAVAVHSSAMIEALRHIYTAGPLADELTGGKPLDASFLASFR